MPMPVCSICTHPERAAIDALLASDSPKYRDIALKFGTSSTSLCRHKQKHLRKDVPAGPLGELYVQTERLARRARQKGDRQTEMAALKELRAITTQQVAHEAIETKERITGEHVHDWVCKHCGTGMPVFKVVYETPPVETDEEKRNELLGLLVWLTEQKSTPATVTTACTYVFGVLDNRTLPEGYAEAVEEFAARVAALEEDSEEHSGLVRREA